MPTFFIETLGCPKNSVDSDKLVGTLEADGMQPAATAADADLVVVNTCAFIEAARQESIETVLTLAEARRPGARLSTRSSIPGARGTRTETPCGRASASRTTDSNRSSAP